jgi:hypothetical protein
LLAFRVCGSRPVRATAIAAENASV